MVRFENLQDLFDKKDTNTKSQIDVKKFATQFYSDANDGATPTTVKIEEVSLSGNQPQSELIKNKFHWIGEDDAEMEKKGLNTSPKDDGS